MKIFEIKKKKKKINKQLKKNLRITVTNLIFLIN